MKDKDFTRIDIKKLSKVPEKGGLYNLIKNAWWVIDKNGKALRFKRVSYQYNINQNVNKSIIKHEDYPGVDQVFIENAWISANERHYG
jgi:hypothetical protein